MGLPVAERPESQDICLGDHRTVVESFAKPDQLGGGEIVDSRGNVLGHHDGVHRFTVGQRKGLGIAAPRPLYVLRIDAERDASWWVGVRNCARRPLPRAA